MEGIRETIRANTPGAAIVLQSIRQELWISQKDFGKMLGVSQVTIHYWEQGQRSIPISVLRKAAVIAKITIQIMILPTGQTKIILVKPQEKTN